MNRDYLSRKESIILTAIEIIDELGIHQLSIRELAKRQGVSQPALYRHYSSKEEIILAVLSYFAHFDEMIINTINEKKMNAKESIIFFINAYTEYYENYPALTALIFVKSILSYSSIVANKIDTIYKKRKEAMILMINKGVEDKEIDNYLDSEEMATVIEGYMYATILHWRKNNHSYSLKEKVLKTVEKVLSIKGF